jgi:hypothetical protein
MVVEPETLLGHELKHDGGDEALRDAAGAEPAASGSGEECAAAGVARAQAADKAGHPGRPVAEGRY